MSYGIGGAGSVPEAGTFVDPVAGTKILLRRSDTQGKKPAEGDAEYGELFINYHSNTPMLCFKDNADTIVEIRPLTALELELGELTDVDTTGATNGMVLAYNGSTWVPVTAASLSVDVDLGYTAAADKGTVTNTAGDDAEIPLATGTNAGLTLNNYTTAEKDKLAGVEDGAEANVGTDLGYTPAAGNGTVTSSTGDDATIPLANGTNAGLSLHNYSQADKDKLDAYPDDPTDGLVDLGYTAAADKGTVTNTAGADAEIPLATDALAGLIVDAPSDGSQYARKDGAWDAVEAGGASVSVGETPPADPAEGDLWWDSSDDSGRLYVWYEDGNTNQWVETSPSGGTPDIPDTYWDKTGNVLSPKDVADDVEIGGGDITLNANGSAEFAGAVSSPALQVLRGSDGANALLVTGANGDTKLTITGGGTIRLGGTVPTSPNITLNADGSAVIKDITNDGDLTSGSTSVGFRISENGFINLRKIGDTGSVLTIFGEGGDKKIECGANGNAIFTGTINGTVVGTSDVRLKKNIAPANPQLADVVALGSQLKNFDWNDDAPLNDELKAKRFLGLVAQEAEKVCPELTCEVGEGADSYKAINHDILVMKMLGAIAEQNTRIETLEAEVASLKGGTN